MVTFKQIIMPLRFILFIANIVLINAGFLISFLIRYGPSIPEYNFTPYKRSFVFLTLIHISALSFFRLQSLQKQVQVFLGLAALVKRASLIVVNQTV